MKIALDGRLIYKRGIGRYLEGLVAGLQKIDKKNSYTLFLDQRSHSIGPLAANWDAKVVRAFNPAWWERVAFPQAVQKGGFDLAHYTDNTGFWNLSCPYLVTIHDTLFFRPSRDTFPKATLYQRMALAYRRKVVPRVARKAGRILTVSEFSSSQIQACLKVPKEKIVVTPEAAGKDFFARKSQAAVKTTREHYGIHSKYILNYGALDLRKNTGLMLEAFALMSKSLGHSLDLVILGMPARELWQGGFGQKAKRLGIEARVHFLSEVSQEDLVALYQGSDLFVFPSKGEGFGLALLEAFASGVPVLTSDAASLPEVAGGAALLLPPFYPDQWASAMVRVLQSPSLRNSMIKKGFSRARQFSWETTARLTLSAYEKLHKEAGID